MRLELSRFIEGDLDAIASYIAQDNPRRAVTFIDDIREKFRDIRRSPLIYALRPDIGAQARMATVGRYPRVSPPDSGHRGRADGGS